MIYSMLYLVLETHIEDLIITLFGITRLLRDVGRSTIMQWSAKYGFGGQDCKRWWHRGKTLIKILSNCRRLFVLLLFYSQIHRPCLWEIITKIIQVSRYFFVNERKPSKGESETKNWSVEWNPFFKGILLLSMVIDREAKLNNPASWQKARINSLKKKEERKRRLLKFPVLPTFSKPSRVKKK